ncbi:MAG: dihydrodipicolinate synthase family protein [Acidimicrobiia bacterium]|nr:dihydrodipicolinate synthase family protein [Acidimicrobiia bacterium]
MKLNAAPGLLVPPLTPFIDGGKIDHPALQREISYILEHCIPQMIVAAGVEAQEYQCLSPEGRKELIRATIEYVDGRCPVAVGVSHPSVDAALALAELASGAGADALQVLAPRTPSGGEPALSTLLTYFGRIEAEVTLPIVLYLNPGPGADVADRDTIELCSLEGVGLVKESSRNMTRIGLLIAEIEQTGLAHYYTTMQVLLPSLLLGGSGAAMPPPAAELGAKTIAAFQKGAYEEAGRLQRQFQRFPALWMKHGLAAVLKEAMSCLGRSVGDPCSPVLGWNTEESLALCAELDRLDLTKGENND